MTEYVKIVYVHFEGRKNGINIRNKECYAKFLEKNRNRHWKWLNKGRAKTDILEKTGCTVGVYDASFEVKQGEIFVIMGLSGSGKSTLIRLINRLIEPTYGSIYIEGHDIAKMNQDELRQVRRHSVNMVFQKFGLFPHKTILENTEYGLEIRGVDKADRQKLAEQALR